MTYLTILRLYNWSNLAIHGRNCLLEQGGYVHDDQGFFRHLPEEKEYWSGQDQNIEKQLDLIEVSEQLRRAKIQLTKALGQLGFHHKG